MRALLHLFFHRWGPAEIRGAHAYFECRVCGERTSAPVVGRAGPLRRDWLEGRE